MWRVLLMAVIGAAAATLLYRALAPFRRIWGGDSAAARTLPNRFGPIKARNYLAYLVWIVPATFGILLLSAGSLWVLLTSTGQRFAGATSLSGFVLFLAGVPLMLVHAVVNATNRPRILVPPPYQDQPGAIAAVRRRWARRRTGAAPTNHPVEIVEIPDDSGRPPWLMAACTAAECDWTAEVDAGLGSADAEHELRRKAHEHTSNIAEHVVRLPA